MTESPSSNGHAESYMSWFIRDQHWSRAGLPMAIVLGLVGPFLRTALGQARFLIFLHVPGYMLHQYEEHGHGAFKAFVIHAFPQARGVTDTNIFIVNFIVWVVNLVALYFARLDRWALSLFAPYMAVANGILHLVTALRERRYNPGLWTGSFLLIPLGLISIVRVAREGHVARHDHVRLAGGAILGHLLAALILALAGKKK